jgi:hypothetical protein
MKETNVLSLRYQVEKWLTPTGPVHVTAFGRSPSGGGRYVCIETRQPAGPRALFFFRHGDGYWRVFPPPLTLLAPSYVRPDGWSFRWGQPRSFSP